MSIPTASAPGSIPYHPFPYYVGNPHAAGEKRREGVLWYLSRREGTPSELESYLPTYDPSSDIPLVLVRNVPSFMAPHEFLDVVSPFRDSIIHVRMLGSMNNKVLHVFLIQMRDAASVSMFRRQFHGKPLSRLSSEMLFVDPVVGLTPPRVRPPPLNPPPPADAKSAGVAAAVSISCCSSTARSLTPARSPLLQDPLGMGLGASLCPEADGALGEMPSQAETAEALQELLHGIEGDASCPYCLDQLPSAFPSGAAESSPRSNSPLELPTLLTSSSMGLDSAVGNTSASGLWTALCGHTVHAGCLCNAGDKGEDSGRCPVCRFNQQAFASRCDHCSAAASLWMCLVCGALGCGRYSGGHAEAHYRATAHTYATELETGAVWDYAGEGYVHRLLALTDGKLVEGGAAAGGLSRSHEREDELDMQDAKFESALGGIADAYARMLEQQLNQQRVHWQGLYREKEKVLQEEQRLRDTRIAALREEEEAARAAAARCHREAQRLQRKLPSLEERCREEEEEADTEEALVRRIEDNLEDYRRRIDDLQARGPPPNPERAVLEQKIATLMAELEGEEAPTAVPPEDVPPADPEPARPPPPAEASTSTKKKKKKK
eukprot:Hpha_TRINITY_DN27461_c0_g1::TRINITY_DN27461_c0_g1_i1::g.193810::m.193810/K10632/BRAP; BRCA1-associated protein